MSQSNNQFLTNHVPQFQFSLAHVDPAIPVPKLFQTPRILSDSKRKPGFLTSSIKKVTVSHLLEVFRPDSDKQKQKFDIKKRIVSDAIQAIYEQKKKQQQKVKLSNTARKRPEVKNQKQEQGYFYRTPPKQAKPRQDSRETAKRSSERTSKLNFSRSETKFSQQQKQTFRKRSGYNV